MKQPATKTTRHLGRTRSVRVWIGSRDPYTFWSITVIMATIVISGLQSTLRPAASAPIVIVATPTLPGGAAVLRGAARPVERAVPPVASRPLATPVPPAAPEPPAVEVISVMQAGPAAAPVATPEAPGYVANTDAGAVFVPDSATPVPTGAIYTGPFLAPATETPSGQRLCTGFHDWRDFDPNYASSPVCHQP